MDFEELLHSLKLFSGWEYGLTFEFLLLEKGEEHNKKPFAWAREKLQLRARTSLSFLKDDLSDFSIQQDSGEDSDDENFGLQIFDHATTTDHSFEDVFVGWWHGALD